MSQVFHKPGLRKYKGKLRDWVVFRDKVVSDKTKCHHAGFF